LWQAQEDVGSICGGHSRAQISTTGYEPFGIQGAQQLMKDCTVYVAYITVQMTLADKTICKWSIEGMRKMGYTLAGINTVLQKSRAMYVMQMYAKVSARCCPHTMTRSASPKCPWHLAGLSGAAPYCLGCPDQCWPLGKAVRPAHALEGHRKTCSAPKGHVNTSVPPCQANSGTCRRRGRWEAAPHPPWPTHAPRAQPRGGNRH
jgi:hypothetical protein